MSSVPSYFSAVYVTFSVILVYVLWTIQVAFSNIFFHSLSNFPGPNLAAASTLYKTCVEGFLGISWHDHLGKLHRTYGPIIRVGPNELHFSDPQAYHDIYNNSNRWDKEESLYHSFGEDRSSFGFLTYKESKERKDVLNRSFSSRAILEAQVIVQGKIDDLCSEFSKLAKTRELANLSYAFRCLTIDVITTYCFGAPISAIQTPNFHAPIIIAMDAAQPAFVMFKHSTLYKNMITKCPRSISRIISPLTAGLVDLQEILENQITKITQRPETLDQLPHRLTIYHSLLDPAAYKSPKSIPSPGSLYEEAQALMFAGADTVGNTLMLLTYHLSKPENKPLLTRLQSELKSVYPNPNNPPPPLSTLETLPYLNATLKESLRLTSGVVSGLPRIVPPTGATISNTFIPPATIVSIGSTFVHYNETLFTNPTQFNPDRWVHPSLTSQSNPELKSETSTTSDLDKWLVAFSRGPRACLGINLAWMELRLVTAVTFRRFEFELDEKAPEALEFKDAFLPLFVSGEVNVRVRDRDRNGA